MFRIDFYKESEKSLNYHMSIIEKNLCIHYEMIKVIENEDLESLEKKILKVLGLIKLEVIEIIFKRNLISLYIRNNKNEFVN